MSYFFVSGRQFLWMKAYLKRFEINFQWISHWFSIPGTTTVFRWDPEKTTKGFTSNDTGKPKMFRSWHTHTQSGNLSVSCFLPWQPGIDDLPIRHGDVPTRYGSYVKLPEVGVFPSRWDTASNPSTTVFWLIISRRLYRNSHVQLFNCSCYFFDCIPDIWISSNLVVY